MLYCNYSCTFIDFIHFSIDFIHFFIDFMQFFIDVIHFFRFSKILILQFYRKRFFLEKTRPLRENAHTAKYFWTIFYKEKAPSGNCRHGKRFSQCTDFAKKSGMIFFNMVLKPNMVGALELIFSQVYITRPWLQF